MGATVVEFATLSEPANCREYVALHQLLGVTKSDRLLDIACGAGLAVELAALRGAECAGIDASERLINIARDRSPTRIFALEICTHFRGAKIPST